MKMNNRLFIYSLMLVSAFIIGWMGFQLIQKNKPLETKTQPIGQMPERPGVGGQRSFSRIASHLELDSEQWIDFVTLEEEYRLALSNKNKLAYETEAEILIELSKPNPDKTLLKKLADETGIIKTETRQLTIDHFLQLKALCSPAQAEKLSELFIEMERGRGHRGRGSANGQRPGMQRMRRNQNIENN